jgi:hypothetical protein
MPSYEAPTEEFRFLLYDFLQIERYANLPGFEEASPDLIDAILEEGGKFMSEVLAPLNQVGDSEGCTFDDGEVTTPTGFKEAYQSWCEAGWGSLTADPDYGGQGLPFVLGFVINEMGSAANQAFAMYPGLSHGAYEAIHRWGTQAQKDTYLPKIVSGEWTGTMNLTEPQCGTDLGLMRTQGGAAGRRQLPDHRHQDLYFGRRTRHGREHHPSGAGQDPRRARWHPWRQPVHRAEIHGR